jgi:hypothetical protein
MKCLFGLVRRLAGNVMQLILVKQSRARETTMDWTASIKCCAALRFCACVRCGVMIGSKREMEGGGECG